MKDTQNKKTITLNDLCKWLSVQVATTEKGKYTAFPLYKLCASMIERNKNLSNVKVTIEYQGKTHNYNLGTSAEILTDINILDIGGMVDYSATYVKSEKGQIDINLNKIPLAMRKKLGLNGFKNGEIEFKYANSNTKASELNPQTKATLKSILLFTPNGYSIVKVENLITDKNGKIFSKSEKNAVSTLPTLNKLSGFEKV